VQTISRTLLYTDSEFATASHTITIVLGAAFPVGAMLLGAEVRKSAGFTAPGLTSADMGIGTNVQDTAAWVGSLISANNGSSAGGLNPLRDVAGEVPQIVIQTDADPNTFDHGACTIKLRYIVTP
jgi:hypothetical protein